MQTRTEKRLPELHTPGGVPVVEEVALPPIFSCGVLTAEKVDSLRRLNVELEDTWRKRQVFRTECEMVFSVLNDGAYPNKAGKYWQCVREQAMMLDNLTIVAFDYRRNEVALKRHERRLAESIDELDREDAQIDIDECLFKRESIRQNANDRVREIETWSDLKTQLDDGTFNTIDHNAEQIDTLYQQLIARRNSLTEHSSPDERRNVYGPLQTIEAFMKSHGD